MRTCLLLTLCLPMLALAADPKKKTPAGDALLGPTKVVRLHLDIGAKDFAAMQPVQGKGGFGGFGGFGKGPQAPPAKGVHRNTFGTEFAWVKGTLAHEGKAVGEVGVRHKGNFTNMASQAALKKSIKIDLNRHVSGQTLDGLKMINLNCNVTDPSRVREAFSFAFFRAAGVPAPRTAFAELSLTVAGKYDKEHVGLYTLVEQVDKTFLARNFGDGKGMLLKPEGLQGGIQYLGDDWKGYADRYKPKDEPTDAQKKRLVAFAKLIHQGTDAEFAKDISSFLDVDAFLRFVAANALLSNLDSYLGFGHNFYLYLSPKTNTFAFVPWDLDLSLAAWPAVGTPEQLVELSLRHPYAGDNKLIDRLLADKAVHARYMKIVEELAKGPFAKDKLVAQLDALEAAVKAPEAAEAKAVAARKEGGRPGFGVPFGGGTFGQSMPPRKFIEARTASVADQLAGKKNGYTPRGFGFGPPAGGGFNPGGFGPPRPGEIVPGAEQQRLRLTPEQRRQLAELQKETDARVEKLLDERQRADWRRMRGIPARP